MRGRICSSCAGDEVATEVVRERRGSAGGEPTSWEVAGGSPSGMLGSWGGRVTSK